MKPWLIFLIGSLILTLLATGGFLLFRRKHPTAVESQRPVGDARILNVLLWFASLSMLAFIVFAFGKR